MILTCLFANHSSVAHSPAAAGLAGSGVVVAGAATWVVVGAGVAWVGCVGAQPVRVRAAAIRAAAILISFMRGTPF